MEGSLRDRVCEVTDPRDENDLACDVERERLAAACGAEEDELVQVVESRSALAAAADFCGGVEAPDRSVSAVVLGQEREVVVRYLLPVVLAEPGDNLCVGRRGEPQFST